MLGRYHNQIKKNKKYVMKLDLFSKNWSMDWTVFTGSVLDPDPDPFHFGQPDPDPLQ